MALFDNIKSLFTEKAETKGFNAQDIQSAFRPLGDKRKSTTVEIAKSLPTLTFPIITALASDFSGIKLKLLQGVEDKEKQIKYNPALTSLMFPNDQTSRLDLFMQYSMYMDIVGEVFWYVPKAKLGRMRNIYTLNPLALQEIRFDDNGTPISYTFTNDKSQPITYSADEVLMDKTVNLGDLRRGFSPVTPIAENIDTQQGAMEYNNKFFANDATPSLLLKVKNTLTEAMRNIIKANWKRNFEGASKAHRFGIIEGDTEVQTLSSSLRDMAFKDIYEVTDGNILSNWRVSKTIIGQSADVNRASIEGAEYNYAKRVQTPKMEKFIAFLNHKYLPLFFDKTDIVVNDIRFEYENPVTQDKETTARIAQIGTGNKQFMSINEARDMLGLEKLEGEEYDEIEMPEEPVETPEAPEQPQEEKPEPEDMPEDDKEKQIESLKMALEGTIEDLKAMESFEQVKAMQVAEIEKKHIEKALKREAKLEPILDTFFAEQQARVIANLESQGVKSIKAYGDILDDPNEVSLMFNAMFPFFSKLAKQAWKDANDRTGVRLPATEAEIAQVAENVTRKAVLEVTSNTGKDLNSILEQAVIKGSSIPEIAKEIGALYDGYKGARSRVIARTEINAVVSEITYNNYESAQRDGIIKGYSWLSVGDERTRDTHSGAERQGVKKVGEKFNLGGELARYPGDPSLSAGERVNCRCTLVPEIF
jgi:HK97 family phage portal protein